jgi:glucose-6-phosphate isomerase
MAWQIIVALTGLALEVNPFDQPDVETAKRCTEAMLGFEPHGAELEAPGARG